MYDAKPDAGILPDTHVVRDGKIRREVGIECHQPYTFVGNEVRLTDIGYLHEQFLFQMYVQSFEHG